MSVAELLDPVSADVFFAEHFERRPCVIKRRDPQRYARLLTLDSLDDALASLDMRYPDVRLVSAEGEIASDEYTWAGDRIDLPRLYRLHAAGATIIVNHFNSRSGALADFCVALEHELSAPCQTNIYLTPARAKGFKAHFDDHDVFVLQAHGAKHWRIFDAPVPLPLAGHLTDEPAAAGEPTLEVELAAGDALYLPRGFVHEAVSLDEPSLHVTLGLLFYTWADFLLEALACSLLRDARFRRALPLGFAGPRLDRAGARATFTELVGDFVQSADFESALASFVDRFTARSRPRLRGQLSQLRLAAALRPESVAAVRPYLAYSLVESESHVCLRCYGNEISMPRVVAPALRHALGTPSFRVGDLPGELEDEDKLVLVRRLVKEGVLFLQPAR